MAKYSILFRRSVSKDLSRLSKLDVKRIIGCIRALSDDPRPPGCEKLSTRERYRIRQGDYRIVYSIQDNDCSIWIVKVGHRRDVYR